MKSSMVSNEIFNIILFIYLFIHTDRRVLRLPLPCKHVEEAKPVLFYRAMHFEMLVSK